MKMYAVGDYLMHEKSGVCVVEDISEKAMSGKGSEKLYYSLRPIFEKDSTVLTPVDSTVRMRDILTSDEISALLDKVPSLPFIQGTNPRAITEIFKEKISAFDIDELATVVKSIYIRKELRLAKGKKVMSSDEKIMQFAGKRLFEEIAFVLDEDVKEAEKAFDERVLPELKGYLEAAS